MDENKQFDNNGEQVTPPVTPPPAPRYRHEHAHGPAAHEKRCEGKEDAFVFRIKWRHLKLAALLAAAFILGSLSAKMKYYHNTYASKINMNCISDIFTGRSSSSSQSSTFSFEVPVTEHRTTYIKPEAYYSVPTPDYSNGNGYGYGYDRNSNQRSNTEQKSYYYNFK